MNQSTILDIQQLLEQGETTSLALTKYYLEKIAAYNWKGPKINAVLEINPDALHVAEALDVERETSGARGPLHGIPILIKDNIDTADKMHTSAGSVALADHFASKDSMVAQKLREAGAIILGKTNMTEWANFMTHNMPNGYSSRGGQVLNPYGPGSFDVGGSSSGSGAAIAADFATASIGTETSGSILGPATHNSIVGIKPTVGLVSRTGIIPIAHSQDTAGPMAKTVTDAAVILGAITGLDPLDPATLTSIGKLKQDYTVHLKKDGLKGARIGVARNYLYELKDDQLEIFDRAKKELEAAGAEVFDIPLTAESPESSVLFHEFKIDINAYLKDVASFLPVHSLTDLIAYNEEHADTALKYGQTVLEESQKKNGTLVDPDYLQDRLNDLTFSQTEGLDKVMESNKLDAVLFPNDVGCDIAARAGYPSITVPSGYTKNGVPISVTFTGLAYSEGRLIELAYAYEQATLHRIPPVLS
ncbi:amidase [Radiobacillus kanasensis]|uniref:amidase family protein n=1 Tax=Radiobacillus kanasensis TaxID=2844358 RepID=UPI001E4299D8|nr:amidase family protein [Radiobacillus kanasensis]UFT99169.1 amidase [Radiobacillus kanasensis]